MNRCSIEDWENSIPKQRNLKMADMTAWKTATLSFSIRISETDLLS